MKPIGTTRARVRVLIIGAVAGALFAALSASPAMAAYTAQRAGGTLLLNGDGASDKLVAAARAGLPDTLAGRRRRGRHAPTSASTAAPSPRSTSRPAAATTRSASTRAAARSPTRP